ncbi:MAG: hypothetical protein PHR78_05480 [Eubacteriales bacterium]|nr:hypothetical protein [Eubacteriales bacterium]MDD4541589.1 hypothetical protein [Eubacteriales bacterium]
MNCSLIDIGGNTIRLKVYKLSGDKYERLFSKKVVAGMATYIEDKKLSKKGIRKLIKVLNSLKMMHDLMQGDRLDVFATASLRNITNAGEVQSQVNMETGIEIQLISAEEETRLGFRGSRHRYNFHRGMSMDIGGGSTEITKFEDETICDMFTLSDGSLSCYSRFVPKILPKKSHFKAIDKHFKNMLPPSEFYDEKLVGVGGTVRAIGNVLQEWQGLEDNVRYDLSQIRDLKKAIADRDKDVIRTILQVAPERVHTIGPGTQILLTCMENFKLNEVFVSDLGLREGYMLDLLDKGLRG